ncbi:MAG: putative F420-0 ABC transporter substrate-binding protein [Rhodoglobus sp.]
MSTVYRPVALALIVACALAGCASARPSTTPGSSAEAASSVTEKNCGTTVVFETAPERVITIKSSTTETLLALGLGERIVGTAFQDGPVPEAWAAEAASIPSISETVPSEEAVLDKKPDLIYAGWESAFSADGVGERSELSDLGVDSYVAPAACQSAGKPAKLDFEQIFGDIEEVAAIFRVDGSALIAAQQETLAAVEPIGDNRSAFWYSSGADTPYAGAGLGAPQLVLETVGLRNIAAEVEATWAPYSWESLVEANPDFIVLVDATWNTAETKIGLLESNPATANLSAVANKRYLRVPFAASEAGVRTVEAAASIAQQIRELDG